MMLAAGKHVLCEKSLTTHYELSKELFDLAKSKNLFLMEVRTVIYLVAGCVVTPLCVVITHWLLSYVNITTLI